MEQEEQQPRVYRYTLGRILKEVEAEEEKKWWEYLVLRFIYSG